MELFESICIYKDKIKNIFVLHSIDDGIFNIGFRDKKIIKDLDLKNVYEKVKADIQNTEIKVYIEKAIVKVTRHHEENARFFYALKNINNIIEMSEKDYNIFLHNFSFESLKNDLHNSKMEYF